LVFDTTDTLQLNASTLGIGTNPVYTILSLYYLSVNNTTGFRLVQYNNGTITPGDYTFATSTGGIMGIFYFDSALRAISFGNLSAQLSLKGMEINRTNSLMYGHLNNNFRQSSVAILPTLTDYNGGNFRLGTLSSGTMTMFDTLIYNRALTQAEYSSIFNYFNGLYGYV
jgi:hypothetical protein